MLVIRDAMNIVEATLTDSLESEVDSAVTKRLESNINLEIGDFAEEDAELAKHYVIPDTKYANSVGSERVKAIKDYTAGSEINGKLIEVEGDPNMLPSNFRKEYTMLMSLKGKVPLPEEHHTYSGTGTFNPMDVTENGIFETPAFMSTSLSMKVAVKTTNYRRDNAHEEEDHVLHFILPKGYTGCYYVAHYSHDPEELEMLIFPKERFKHVSSQKLMLGGVTRHVHTFEPLR